MRIARWALVLASVVAYRVWFPETHAEIGIRLDFDLIIIALIGLYRGQRAGAGGGWIIGLTAHATDPDHLAWGSLLGALLGWLVGHWRQRLFLEQIWSRWIVFSLGFFVYKLLHLALIRGTAAGTWLNAIALHLVPTVLISATAGILLGVILERSRAIGSTAVEKVLPEGNQ